MDTHTMTYEEAKATMPRHAYWCLQCEALVRDPLLRHEAKRGVPCSTRYVLPVLLVFDER